MVQIIVTALLLATALAPVIAMPIEAREARKISSHHAFQNLKVATTVGGFAGSVSTTNTDPQKRELDEIDARKPRGGFRASARGVRHQSGAAKLEAREVEVEEIDACRPRGSFHSSAHKSRRGGRQATPAAVPIAEARDFEVEEVEAREPRGGPRGRRGVRQIAAAAPVADVRDLEAGIEVRQPRIIKIKPFSTCALCR